MKSETITLLERKDFDSNYVYFLNVALQKSLINKQLIDWSKKRNRKVNKYFIRWTDKAGFLDIYYE